MLGNIYGHRSNGCFEKASIEERIARLRQRFESHIMPVTESGCWIWLGSEGGGGYGTINYGNRNHLAHRYSYEQRFGSIATGLVLDHLCRVPLCVNPDHLEIVTDRVNILRGIGKSAQNAKKTHCYRGHPLSDPNLIRTKRNGRLCRTCYNARARSYQQKYWRGLIPGTRPYGLAQVMKEKTWFRNV